MDAIRARLDVLLPQEGGRHGPIATGYRAGCWIDPGDPAVGGHDGIVIVESGEPILPGTNGIVNIRFLRPELLRDKPPPGTTFELREGPRVVARATVIGPA